MPPPIAPMPDAAAPAGRRRLAPQVRMAQIGVSSFSVQ